MSFYLPPAHLEWMVDRQTRDVLDADSKYLQRIDRKKKKGLANLKSVPKTTREDNCTKVTRLANYLLGKVIDRCIATN